MHKYQEENRVFDLLGDLTQCIMANNLSTAHQKNRLGSFMGCEFTFCNGTCCSHYGDISRKNVIDWVTTVILKEKKEKNNHSKERGGGITVWKRSEYF